MSFDLGLLVCFLINNLIQIHAVKHYDEMYYYPFFDNYNNSEMEHIGMFDTHVKNARP